MTLTQFESIGKKHESGRVPKTRDWSLDFTDLNWSSSYFLSLNACAGLHL